MRRFSLFGHWQRKRPTLGSEEHLRHPEPRRGAQPWRQWRQIKSSLQHLNHKTLYVAGGASDITSRPPARALDIIKPTSEVTVLRGKIVSLPPPNQTKNMALLGLKCRLISQAKKVKMTHFKSPKSSTWCGQCRESWGKDPINVIRGVRNVSGSS